MNELSLIKKISSLIPQNSYIGDDTAYLKELGVVVTTDTLVEDVHFRLKTTTPYNLGYKSLAVNLSDIASDGAIPAYAFVSLSLPKYIDENFVEDFYKGMDELCSKYNVIIAGGDVTASEKLFINITVIGKTDGLSPARRDNAKVGDVVITTGSFGSSRAGLEILENSQKYNNIPREVKQKFILAHQKPIPHLETGRKIVEYSAKIPAMMDTSDGLADALFKIAHASEVKIQVEEKLIPIDIDLEKIAEGKSLEWALFGGEDYTLLACVDEKIVQKLGKEVSIIGKVVSDNENAKVIVKSQNNDVIIDEKSLQNKCFQHFE